MLSAAAAAGHCGFPYRPQLYAKNDCRHSLRAKAWTCSLCIKYQLINMLVQRFARMLALDAYKTQLACCVP